MEEPTRSHETAADVMTVAPRTCSLFSSVLEAVMIFRDLGCGAVPVVDDGVPVGILTDRDVALASTDDTALLSRPVTDIMSKGAVTVAPDASLAAVREKLGARGTRHLLVIGANGRLQGIITASDIAPAMPVGTLAPS
jgi:CBS domain-containing protein